MARVKAQEMDTFFNEVKQASAKAEWAALATVAGNEPRVRIITPAWEGRFLWFATSRQSAKAKQLFENPAVDLQFQVSSPEYIHILVRGQAGFPDDSATRQRVWDLIRDDLSEFYRDFNDPDYMPVRVNPTRVELSEMHGTVNKRVWMA